MLTAAPPQADRSKPNAELSPSAVQSAIEAVMRSSGGTVDSALAASLMGKIHAGLSGAFRGGAPADLAGDPTFNRLLKEQLGNPAHLMSDQQRAAMLAYTIQNSNFSGADRAAALSAVERQFGQLGHLVRAALERGDGGGGSGLSSVERGIRLNGGPYSSGNLSDLRGYVDLSRGYTASHVADTGNYLYGLGIDRRYAGHFMGSSETVRTAIGNHIRSGAQMTDEHITNPSDVRAVMGAIKSGRMKAEDAPPSVRQIMDDMKAKGIDPSKAEPSALDKYFKDNPKALEAAKQEVAKATHVDASRTTAQVVERTAKLEAVAAANAPKAKPEAAKTTSGLGL